MPPARRCLGDFLSGLSGPLTGSIMKETGERRLIAASWWAEMAWGSSQLRPLSAQAADVWNITGQGVFTPVRAGAGASTREISLIFSPMWDGPLGSFRTTTRRCARDVSCEFPPTSRGRARGLRPINACLRAGVRARGDADYPVPSRGRARARLILPGQCTVRYLPGRQARGRCRRARSQGPGPAPERGR